MSARFQAKKILVFLMFLYLPTPAFVSVAEPIDYSFDQLFPNSPMKNILDKCGQISDDLVSLHEQPQSPALCSLIMDAILGKMVRLHNAVHHCVLLYAHDISAEDILYTLTVFDRLENHYKKTRILHDEHRILTLHFLQESKTGLHALLAQ